jgi:hypothetical protein
MMNTEFLLKQDKDRFLVAVVIMVMYLWGLRASWRLDEFIPIKQTGNVIRFRSDRNVPKK